MTTMTPVPERTLRRSSSDRVLTGVAGGLGAYFGIDPVIFRVLFVVLSFFGGAGLATYLVFWLLLPEEDIAVSALDRGIAWFRSRRIPPWVVIVGGAFAIWVMWFSWWQPRPSFFAFIVFSAVLIYLIGRVPSLRAPTMPVTPTAPTTSVPPVQDSREFPVEGSSRLAPPLNDTRRTMQAWFAEANAAHRERIRRRRPFKVGALLALAIACAITAAVDFNSRVAFPVYLWVGLTVLGVTLLASIAARRAVWSLLASLAVLGLIASVFGGTSASLRDGSGQISWRPAASAQLTDHRQFAGQTIVDLSAITHLDGDRTITISQAAGRIELQLPSDLDVVVHGKVHAGNIEVGDSRDPGDYVSGWNVALDVPAPSAASGSVLTINVDLTAGHLQIERIG